MEAVEAGPYRPNTYRLILKLAWVGVAAIAAVLLFLLWLCFIPVDHVPPPDRFKQIDNTTTTQTAQPPPTPAATAKPSNVTAKPPSTTTEPSPRPSAAIKLSFNASSYEVNYTFVFTVSLSGITVTIEGWMVVGTGPFGNYSFGMMTVPLHGTATFKSATEGNVIYTMKCFRGECVVDEEGEWPFVGLIDGINVTRTAKGQCRRLNYTGTLYEERGVLDPKALPRFIGELSGNYTAYVCEVNGVMLAADLVATASTYGETIRITLKMEAVEAGPYRPNTYRLILKEIKAANQ
jgi:hypothetical protein